jgi:hypothetical protein
VALEQFQGIINAGQPVRHLGEPYASAAAVTPDDGNDLPNGLTRAVYIGGAGDVTVNMASTGTAITFKAVPVGTVLPIRAARVKATGTTATLILALW